MKVQWYPGHMTKSIRSMEEDIRLIDLVIELADARIPLSSRNPDVEKLAKGKARILLLNKSDLSDEKENRKWQDAFRTEGLPAVFCDSRKNTSTKALLPVIQDACREKIERNRRKGILNRPLRAMVVGIPNVGKSTFINSFSGRAMTKTGNKPGVTKGKQWIRMNKDVELLDTPGILWPRIEDEWVGENLALVGAISDDILDLEELAVLLIRTLKKAAPGAVQKRYSIEEDGEAFEILQKIAVRRGALKNGGSPDTEKAARILIDEFRSGMLGRITLEKKNDG